MLQYAELYYINDEGWLLFTTEDGELGLGTEQSEDGYLNVLEELSIFGWHLVGVHPKYRDTSYILVREVKQ